MTFSEVELHYILEAVMHYNEVALKTTVRPEDQAVYRAELDGLTQKILNELGDPDWVETFNGIGPDGA